MMVLEAWLGAQGGRAVVLHMHDGKCHADAVVSDDDWPPAVNCSRGEDTLGLASLDDALLSLDQVLEDEAQMLVEVAQKR